jgi:uncharacterized protein with HEPN domain
MPHPLDIVVADMLEAIEQASSFVRGMSFAKYCTDPKTQRAVERTLEVISEASRHIPADMKKKHPGIPWKKAAGIGNVMRHDYRSIANKVIWDTVRERLPELEKAMLEIKAELES